MNPVALQPEMASAFLLGLPERRMQRDLMAVPCKLPHRIPARHQVDIDAVAAPARAIQNSPFRFRSADDIEIAPEFLRDGGHALDLDEPVDPLTPPQAAPE